MDTLWKRNRGGGPSAICDSGGGQAKIWTSRGPDISKKGKLWKKHKLLVVWCRK